MVNVLSRDTLPKVGRLSWSVLTNGGKFILLAIPGLLFVAIVAFLISVVQFQLRIIDAKTQSKNFSLTSLTQSVQLQKNFEDSVEVLQRNEPIVAQFEDLQGNYFSQIAQFANFICYTSTTVSESDHSTCALGISGALINGSLTDNGVHNAVKRYASIDVENSSDNIKSTVAEIAKLAKARYGFSDKNGEKLAEFRLACTSIQLYIKVFSGENATGMNVIAAHQQFDRSSMAYSFNWEYVQASTGRCFSNNGLGGATVPLTASSKSTAQAAATHVAAPPPAPPATGAEAPPPPPPPAAADSKNQIMFSGTGGTIGAAAKTNADKRDNLEADLSGALFFDLVSYYRFYEKLLDGIFGPPRGSRLTQQMVTAPIDITFVILVIFCGAFGAMLRIIAERYNPELFGKDSTDVTKKHAVYYFVIGIMCALIIYIIAKTAFAGLTDSAYAAKSNNLSPFVTALLGIVSGLLCEEAFQRVITAGRSLLARSTSSGG